MHESMWERARRFWYFNTQVHRYPERFWLWLAGRLPRRLVYWAAIRLWAEATHKGPWSPDGDDPSMPFSVACQRWDPE